jgi:hypothetical protein
MIIRFYQDYYRWINNIGTENSFNNNKNYNYINVLKLKDKNCYKYIKTLSKDIIDSIYAGENENFGSLIETSDSSSRLILDDQEKEIYS